jgi:hypothetical protein
MKKQDTSKCISVIKNKLINAIVVDIIIGYSTKLVLYNDNKDYYYIRIENSEIQIENKSYKIVSSNINTKLILAEFYDEKISNLEIDDNGNLSLGFNLSSKIIMTNYEAWEIDGPNTFKIVCALGGELVCWYKE